MKTTIVNSNSSQGLNSKIAEMEKGGWKTVGDHKVVIVRVINRYAGTQHMDSLYHHEHSITMVLKESRPTLP